MITYVFAANEYQGQNIKRKLFENILVSYTRISVIQVFHAVTQFSLKIINLI
jgi:hypothetical protein